MRLSARNVLKGTIKEIEVGAVNVDVMVEVASGLEMSSIITKRSSENLGLEVGKEVYVVIKASNVIIGVDK
jgi:molybdopterin-binding protein